MVVLFIANPQHVWIEKRKKATSRSQRKKLADCGKKEWKREREREREREIVMEKAGWKGAPNHTLWKKQSRRTCVSSCFFSHLKKQTRWCVKKLTHFKFYQRGRAVIKQNYYYLFCRTRADQIIHTFNEEQTKENRTSGNWIWGAKRLKLKQKILKMFPLENLTSQITILFLLKL